MILSKSERYVSLFTLLILTFLSLCCNNGTELENGSDLELPVLTSVPEITEFTFPSSLSRGDLFIIKVSLGNTSPETISSVSVKLNIPFTLYSPEPEWRIDSISSGSELSHEFPVLALYGGRDAVSLTLNGYFGVVESALSPFVNISGPGIYGGDNHSHTVASDGARTRAQNATVAYEWYHRSWLITTEHNNFNRSRDTDPYPPPALAGKPFVSLIGMEYTTNYKYYPFSAASPGGGTVNRGHALMYRYKDGNTLPNLNITAQGGGNDWQDIIDEINSNGGFLYLAHPSDRTYTFETPHVWRNFAGVEVYNSGNGPFHYLNTQARILWDQLNIRGEKKFFGAVGSDAHFPNKAGNSAAFGYLENLAEDEIFNLLKNGKFYGTNGPDIWFSINGVGMGDTLIIPSGSSTTMEIKVSSKYSYLTEVKVQRCFIGSSGYVTSHFSENMYGKKIKTYNKKLDTAVITGKEFYRVEVLTDTSQPGIYTDGVNTLDYSSFTETAYGFAFSNPIWVESGSRDTSLMPISVTYKGLALTLNNEGFGNYTLGANADFSAVSPADFNVTFNDPSVTCIKRWTPVNNDGRIAGILDIITSSSVTGANSTISYVMCKE